MKILFIGARKKFGRLDKRDVDELNRIKERNIGILASLQYISLLKEVKKELEKKGKRVFMAKGEKTKYDGQILGCDISAASRLAKKVDAFLFIGSGRFHALSLLTLHKKIFVWQPGARLIMLDDKDEEILKLRNRIKANKIKFLSSENIGVLVSTKIGQENLNAALQFKKKWVRKGKKVFIFIADSIRAEEIENFSLPVWVNFACPTLILDIPNLINYNELSRFRRTAKDF